MASTTRAPRWAASASPWCSGASRTCASGSRSTARTTISSTWRPSRTTPSQGGRCCGSTRRSCSAWASRTRRSGRTSCSRSCSSRCARRSETCSCSAKPPLGTSPSRALRWDGWTNTVKRVPRHGLQHGRHGARAHTGPAQRPCPAPGSSPPSLFSITPFPCGGGTPPSAERAPSWRKSRKTAARTGRLFPIGA